MECDTSLVVKLGRNVILTGDFVLKSNWHGMWCLQQLLFGGRTGMEYKTTDFLFVSIAKIVWEKVQKQFGHF